MTTCHKILTNYTHAVNVYVSNVKFWFGNYVYYSEICCYLSEAFTKIDNVETNYTIVVPASAFLRECTKPS